MGQSELNTHTVQTHISAGLRPINMWGANLSLSLLQHGELDQADGPSACFAARL